MDVVLDRRAYADLVDEPEHLLEPLPQCCPAHRGVSLMPFKLMLPTSDGQFVATFEIDAFTYTNGCLVRYGDRPAVHFPWRTPQTMFAEDVLTIYLKTSRVAPHFVDSPTT